MDHDNLSYFKISFPQSYTPRTKKWSLDKPLKKTTEALPCGGVSWRPKKKEIDYYPWESHARLLGFFPKNKQGSKDYGSKREHKFRAYGNSKKGKPLIWIKTNKQILKKFLNFFGFLVLGLLKNFKDKSNL